MPLLSLIMIVKDEAARLRECLASVRAIVDEVVIADTGSRDDTIAIARSLGAKVHEVPWNDDFAEARNRGMTFASGDWLLHLDADEAVDPTSAQRIREVVNGDGFGADAVEVTVANYCNAFRSWRWVPVASGDPFARGFSGYLHVKLLRLFRNRKGFEYREPVHENITESVRERNGVVRAEPIIIHHYGLVDQTGRSTEKGLFYLGIARKKVDQRPRDPKSWFDLGEQLFALGMVAEAEEAQRTALALAPQYVDAAMSLANVLLNRGEFEEAEPLLCRVAEAGVRAPHVETALAAIAWKQNRLEEARRRLEQVLQQLPEAIIARLYLARTLDQLGDPEGAKRHLELALASAPGVQELHARVEAHRLRLDAGERLRQGQPQQALGLLVKALGLDSEDPLIHNDLGVVLSTLGFRDKAEQSFRRALQIAPGMPEATENLAAMKGGTP